MNKRTYSTTLVHHVIQIIVTPPIQELKNGNFLERLHLSATSLCMLWWVLLWKVPVMQPGYQSMHQMCIQTQIMMQNKRQMSVQNWVFKPVPNICHKQAVSQYLEITFLFCQQTDFKTEKWRPFQFRHSNHKGNQAKEQKPGQFL